MKRGPKPATVRFYFDADVLGLAKVVAGIRSDVTFPGDPGGIVHKRQRPSCEIARPATLDTAWLAVVAQRGWLIITRDRHIQDHRAEIDAVNSNGARMIANEAVGTWSQLEVLMCQWRAIERLGEPGPFIYTATRTSLRPVPLT